MWDHVGSRRVSPFVKLAVFACEFLELSIMHLAQVGSASVPDVDAAMGDLLGGN